MFLVLSQFEFWVLGICHFDERGISEMPRAPARQAPK